MSTPPPLPSTPPPLPPSSVPADEAAPTACVNCGSIHFSPHTKLPVCEPCRSALVRFPFPVWVKLAAAVVAVLVLTSLALSKGRVEAALHIAHTKKMQKQERWEEAYQGYHSVVAPRSDTELVLDYAESALNSGHPQDAVRALNFLEGRPVIKAVKARIDSIVYRLQQSQRPALMPLAPLNSSPIRL